MNTKFLLITFCTLTLFFSDISLKAKQPKIVGLMQVRNESLILEQCLHALSLYCDAIVILDDASDDNTLDIIKSCAHQYKIEKIMCNETCAWLNKVESYNRQKLLEAGREIGGTHFIIIDADEMFTSTFLKNNYLRTLIYKMQPGDRIQMHWISLWKSIHQFRSDANSKNIIFCDDGQCYYEPRLIHVPRIPENLKNGVCTSVQPYLTFGLLHFQATNWFNMEIRRAWYHCFLKIRKTDYSAQTINKICSPQYEDAQITLMNCPKEWYNGYPFFKPEVYEARDRWRERQILNWFNQYGQDYFKDLHIWHIHWNKNI
jgi:glycosyltransferase involved in cell wall biosynthesis